MKIYLDDCRTAPDDWVRVKTASAVIEMLKSGNVKHISLDHDLGLPNETGYDVLIWIEVEVAINNFIPPEIEIHTANPSAKRKMEWAVGAIKKLHAKNKSNVAG